MSLQSFGYGDVVHQFEKRCKVAIAIIALANSTGDLCLARGIK